MGLQQLFYSHSVDYYVASETSPQGAYWTQSMTAYSNYSLYLQSQSVFDFV